MNNLFFAICAGGAGLRFWPISTPEKPKQFLKLFGDRSMIQLTYDRIKNISENILVITSNDHIETVKNELPDVRIIGEQEPKDTAAAIIAAAYNCLTFDPDPIMVVLPADHLIEPIHEFEQTLMAAVDGCWSSHIPYTFGIMPTYPATIYGYLEIGDVVADDGTFRHYKLNRFQEKPKADVAQQLFNSGKYLWNSGMFVFHVNSLIESVKIHLPEFCKLEKCSDNPDYTDLPKISIDVGLMEKLTNVRVLPAKFKWSDVGGWLALEELVPSRGQIFSELANNNFIFSEDEDEIIGVLGLDDIIVIRSGNKTLIANKKELDRIKDLANKINLCFDKKHE